jgi:hypothetical protein
LLALSAEPTCILANGGGKKTASWPDGMPAAGRWFGQAASHEANLIPGKKLYRSSPLMHYKR